MDKEKNYDLDCQYDEKSETLELNLKKDGKLYKSILKNDNLPRDLEKHLDSLENVFDCLADDENYEFDEEQKQIKIKTITQLKNKKIEKISLIQLEEISHSMKVEEENLSVKVRQMQKKLLDYEKMKEDFINLTTKVNKLEELLVEQNAKLERERKEKDMLGNKVEILEQKISNILDRADLYEKKKQEEKITQINFSPNVFTSIAKKFFKVHANTITYIGLQEENTQIMFRTSFSKKGFQQFTVKILQTREAYIAIGVVDADSQENDRNSSQSGNAICFWGYNGRIRHGNAKNYRDTGFLFGKGDIVTTAVSLEKGVIYWEINGIKRGEFNSDILGKPRRRFVPYLEMSDSGDKVEWLS